MKKLPLSIKEVLKGKSVIVGIGNRLRGDDAFGPVMIDRLRGKTKRDLIDAGTAPESYLGPIIKKNPETIIIMDVADMGKAAGELGILDGEDILKVGFSTHDSSPKVFMDFLKETTGARIVMIAAQPKTLEFGENPSREVKESMDKLEEILL